VAETTANGVLAGPAEARRLLDRLRLRPLLDGLRGRPPADLEALVRAIARFSEISVALAPVVEEIDVNPLLALPDRAVALDALVVPRQEADQPLGASAAKRPADLFGGISTEFLIGLDWGKAKREG